MQVTALIVFLSVAFVGATMLVGRRKGIRIPPLLIRSHGIFAVLGLLILLVGAVGSWVNGDDNTWTWVSLALLSSVVSGAYLLFKKLLKGRRKPIFVLYAHGLFACISIGVLMYALIG